MPRNSNTSGWNLDQGLAAQYAAQAGLDPDLAAGAGEEVWDVLKSLRDATSENDPGRQAKLVRRTKARLAKANLSRHGELVQHIEAKLFALQGRGGDTELAHLTPGEMIIPPQLQTPEVVQALHQAAQNAGVDMRRYTAGSPASRVNPETGLEEYRYSSQHCGDLTPMGLCLSPLEEITVTGRAGSYYPGLTNYNGIEITGSGTGGSGGGSSGGGEPYGPEPEDDDPNNETISEPIDTLVHRFVYDENGNLVPKQPGVTSYDPLQFSGIWGTPNLPLNPIGLSGGGGFPIGNGQNPDPVSLTQDENLQNGHAFLDNLSKEQLIQLKTDLADAANKTGVVATVGGAALTVAAVGAGVSASPAVLIASGLGVLAFGFNYLSNQIDRRLNFTPEQSAPGF